MINSILLQQKRYKSNTDDTIHNQQEEINYFNAYLLPLSDKALIQEALDTYGAVRLEQGDYSGVDIVMKSNQRLYGNLAINSVNKITIQAGSSNVYIDNVISGGNSFVFESGAEIYNCTIKTAKYSSINAINARLKNCNFIDFSGVITLDSSQSGYSRNTTLIKHQIQTNELNLIVKGNSETPSYGNVHLMTNFITPGNDTTELENLQSCTFVGIDGEGWNLDGIGTKALIYARNVLDMKIVSMQGANDYSPPIKTPAFDIDATELFMFTKQTSSDPISLVSDRTNVLLMNTSDKNYVKNENATGYDWNLHVDNLDIEYNGAVVSTVDTSNPIYNIMKTKILGVQHTPWVKPNWEVLPNPLGINWKTERIGKPDSRAYIQNLIDNDKIGELPEGVFYISSTINMPLDNEHGLIGKGTGKTIICGLTDDFPLITLGFGSTARFFLGYLTLQGGNTGILSDIIDTQIAYQNLKYVIFREVGNGIHLKKITGLDNNFFDNIAFVGCRSALYKEPERPYIDLSTSSYVDKTVFYESQFIDCELAMDMDGTRADNLNAWIGCKFSGGGSFFNMTVSNSPFIANSELNGCTGDYTIKANSVAFYNSKFDNNLSNIATFKGNSLVAEGCEFLDNIDLTAPVQFNRTNSYLVNCIVNGNVIQTIPPVGGYYPQSGIYMNTTLNSNSDINKLLVNLKDNVTTIILDEEPNPYPQLLVTQ
ncbi:MAG TPA: hypothetical protein VLA48_03315 [Nitrososphaeraceae archaeon]|nr:hypothetical protein [Nitrososphaeraceae archaeon]